MRSNDIKFEIVENIGVIGLSTNDWTKELNVVAWNGYPPKYDLRTWSPDRSKFTKGFTFTEAEAIELLKLLQDILGELAEDNENESDMLKGILMKGYFGVKDGEQNE